MAHHRDLLGMNLMLLGDEVVENPRQPPCPGSDGAPFTGARFCLAGLVEKRVNAVSVVMLIVVGINVAAVGGRDGVASVDQFLDLPSFLVDATGGLGLSVRLRTAIAPTLKWMSEQDAAGPAMPGEAGR